MSGWYVFFPAAGFAAGIFVRTLYAFSWQAIALVALAACLAAGVWWSARKPLHLLVALALVGMLAGVLRTALVPQSLPSAFAAQLGQGVSLTGIVAAAPDVRDTNQRIIMAVTQANETTRVLAVVSRAAHVAYGERVTVRGVLDAPKPFATDYGRTFHYDHYLAAQGVFAIMYHASLTEVARPSGVWVHMYGTLIDGKQAFLHALGQALPEPAASLAGGLVAGGTQGLGNSLLDDFVRSGLIHIVVLSGYNVMIVAEAVLAALAVLSRRWAATIAALVIGAFVLAAGAGAASIRAGLMAGFALLARATGRTYNVTRALVIAALLMLLWNPLLLAYSIGFDLSVVATLGLILGVPLIEPKLAFIKSAFLRETIAATMTAQIAVLPLLLYSNGLFSLVALPANVLVLPVVPAAMAASAVAGAAGILVPIFAPVIALPAYVLLSYITTVVHDAATLPLAAFAVPRFSFLWVVLAYALLGLLVHWLVEKNKTAGAPAPAVIQF